MLLFFLFIFVFILAFISYVQSKEDLLAPATLQCILFGVCIFGALINIDYWGIDYQIKTMLIMMIGIVSFVLPSFLFFGRNSKGLVVTNIKSTIELTNHTILWLLVIFDLVLTIFYFYQVYKVSIRGGNPYGILGASTYYRMYVASDSGAEGLSTLMNQFLKLGRGFGFVSVFIVCFNFQIKKNLRGDMPLILLILLFVLQSLIGGARGYILWLIGIGFTTCYVTNRKINGVKKRDNVRYMRLAAKLMIIILPVFFLLKFIVRIENSDNSIFSYISYYVSGAIQNFNLYIINPPEPSQHLGQESFVGVYATLDLLGIVDITRIYPHNSNLEFRVSNGINIGNVYGAIRRYYNDFGIWGVIILQGLSSIFFNSLYKRIRYSSNINTFKYFMYCLMTYHIYEIAIDDAFYRSFISFNMLTTFFIYYCVYFLLTRIRFSGMSIIIRHSAKNIMENEMQ